jgi:DNA-binding transcriptional MocR family regulator
MERSLACADISDCDGDGFKPHFEIMTSLSYSNDQDTLSEQAGTPGGDGNKVQRIVEAIGQAMAAGHLTPDQRLPSIRAMAVEHGVSRDTVQRAYDKLVASGRVHPRRGAGFYVVPTTPPPVRDNARPPIDLEAFQLVHSDLPPDHIPGSGLLHHDEGSTDELARVLKGAATLGRRLGSYGDPAGYLPLREELQNKLRVEGVDAPIRSIMTVPGCIAGMTLCVRTFVRYRTPVFVEDPASFAHVAVLLAQGAEIYRIPREADGPNLEVLRLMCERHRPKVFLLSSLLQNPTGTSISLHKARKLLEIAAEFDLMLIDDASYADLAPVTDGRTVVPLILLDQLEHVIHIGGFSQILAPETGVGYIVAGEQFMKMMRVFRPVQGLGNILIPERVLYRFLHDGMYRRRCERIRSRLQRSTAALRQLLASTPVKAVYPMVTGGIFLWVNLGEESDSMVIAKRMLAKGYLTAPGSHFVTTKIKQPFMRFNVTTTTPAAIKSLVACL